MKKPSFIVQLTDRPGVPLGLIKEGGNSAIVIPKECAALYEGIMQSQGTWRAITEKAHIYWATGSGMAEMKTAVTIFDRVYIFDVKGVTMIEAKKYRDWLARYTKK